jgi:Flp pilus assembly protein TadG
MTAFWLQDPTVLFNNAGITQIIPTSDMDREARLNAMSRLIIVLTLLGYLITMSYSVLLLGVISLAGIAILSTATNAAAQNAATNPTGKKDAKEGFSNYANYNTGRRRKHNNNSNNNSKHNNNSNNNSNRVMSAPSGLTFQAPTPQDPLMNVLLTDIQDRPNRPAAEPAFNPDVELEINQSTKTFVVNDMDGNRTDLEDRLFRDLGDNYEFSNSMRNYFATPNTRIPNDQHAFAEFCYGSMISCKEGNMMACARANPVLGSITGAQ